MRIAEVAHQQGFDGFFKISGFARTRHGFNQTKPNGSGQSIERVTAQFRSRSAPVSQETTLGPTVQLLCASGGV